MKHIAITSFHPLISRNIFAAGLLGYLTKNQNTRVTVFVPQAKKNFFEAEFAAPRVRFVGIDRMFGWRDRILRFVALAGLATRTMAIKRRAEMKGSGAWTARLIGGERWLRVFLQIASARFLFRRGASILLKEHAPALLFASDVENDADVLFMASARRLKIPIVGIVRSWDNLTSKGLLRILPDFLAVHNEIESAEAKTYHGMPPDKIRIVGIPHYDAYLRHAPVPREEFFERIGAPPAKRLILFAPAGDRYLSPNPTDKAVVEILDRALPQDCHILVRLPPTDTVKNIEEYRSRRVTIERPTRRFKTLRNAELSPEDDRHLADTLFWSDLVIAGPSTMCVDAAVFDKPVILVGFDTHGKNRPYGQSIRRYYDYDHFRPILASGGVRYAATPKDFIDAVRSYLADPRQDQEGRRRIVREQCGGNDGMATQRLADLLLSPGPL